MITVSDRSFAGERGDRSGPLLANLLAELGYLVDGPVVVPDDVAAITAELYRSIESEYDLVFTTGGTGVAPRDVTPEATLAVVEREVPGIAELLRSSVAQRVPTSWLSRGIAGTAGHTLVVNLAGSTGAVRDGISALSPLLGHVISQLHGGDHHEA
ncbi:MAG: MogA/MoaB family molybdenum cofactor biosynthesis protein [Actinobacteria bacterium]|nr:MogA/MoaB family molybdenum cofactor biosynthesis protein [Actinomycetota bacterium]